LVRTGAGRLRGRSSTHIQVTHLLRDEYRIRRVTKVTGSSIEELADKNEGIDTRGFVDTVRQFNAAVQRDVSFNPRVLGGRGTVGVAAPKSNWANPLEQSPYEAYGVTCGITYTFGRVRVNHDANVIDSDGAPMANLFACGEMVGGLFYFNYPGGTGLTSGAVFGRLAGANAAVSSTG